MLELASIFDNNMVLQRGKTVVIWGLAEPHAHITVQIQGQTATAVADNEGVWQVTLAPLHTSFAEKLVVQTDCEELILQDVQVGEVWLAGGQSNMELPMCFDLSYESERASCTDDALRFYDVPETSYIGQLKDADYSLYGFWRRATPDDLGQFSATAYYFAKVIRRCYNIPVGIIGCNWGGTPACSWMSEQAIRAGGGQILLDEYIAAIQNLDLPEYERHFNANPANFRTNLLHDPIHCMMHAGATPAEMDTAMERLGLLTTWGPPLIGPKYEKRPSGLYKTMLKPLAPYALRGIIWYQGETDGDTHPELYATLFPALIADWRQLWKEELPFLFVQIAPLERWLHCVGEPYATIRTAQQHTVDTVPGTGMAVITDAGMRWDIHPKAKRPVGERLALLARHLVYSEDILCEAPTLDAVFPDEGKLTLHFLHVGTGLHLAWLTPYGEALPAEQMTGITVVQNGVKVDTNSLTAYVSGDTVILSGSTLHAVATEVGIAQGGWYQINLYNSVGLPARPAVCKN